MPNEEEIRTALKLMKNGRAPGADGISAELLKLGGDTVVRWLLHLATVVWEEERVPEDWVKQLTIPLHKKGSMQDCDNYRGIALLSVPGKVFCRVIQRRLAKRAEQMLRENQCGFRRGRGCIDHIFTLRTLAEKAREFNTTLYLSFVDLRKAYDSVNREALWLVLERRYQVPRKLIRILRALHQGTKGAVRAGRCLSTCIVQPFLGNLFEASADVPHSLDKAYLSVETGSWKVGWTLQQTGQVVQGDLFRCNPSPLLGYYWLKVPPWSPERPTAIWTPPTATSGEDG